MYNFRKYTFNRLAIKAKAANVKSVLLIVFLVHNLVFTAKIQAQNIFSYSYQNVSKNNGGGTLEKGDTIEIRALIKVEITTPNLYFIDTIRPGTKYIDNSLKVITNEGLTFRGHFTNSDNDDQGVYDITGMLPRLRINLGVGAQYARAGTANNRFGNLSGGGTVTPNVQIIPALVFQLKVISAQEIFKIVWQGLLFRDTIRCP